MNTQDQRLATADETTPRGGIASPLHRLGSHMPDIVDELRKLPGDRCRPCLEAADEIERLRVNLRLADAGFTFGPPALTDEEREAMDRLCRAVARHSALQRIRGLKDHFADEDEQAYSIVCGWLARLA
jgi:HEAT repeat protein